MTDPEIDGPLRQDRPNLKLYMHVRILPLPSRGSPTCQGYVFG